MQYRKSLRRIITLLMYVLMLGTPMALMATPALSAEQCASAFMSHPEDQPSHHQMPLNAQHCCMGMACCPLIPEVISLLRVLLVGQVISPQPVVDTSFLLIRALYPPPRWTLS